MYIGRHHNRLCFDCTTQSKSLVVPCTETMHDFYDYVSRHHLPFTFVFSLGFTLSLNPNWTLLILNQGSSSRFRKIPELNRWSSLGFRQNRPWTKLNRTFSTPMLSIISCACVGPCSFSRYCSTHTTKWSLKVPLMSWCKRSGASNLQMLAHGK